MRKLIEQPTARFRRNLRVEVEAGQGVFFFSEGAVGIVNDRLAEFLAERIDGHQSMDDLVAAAVAAGWHVDQVRDTLLKMEQQGLIYDCRAVSDSQELEIWQHLGGDLKRIASIIKNASVQVIALSGINSNPMTDALLALGVRVADDGKAAVVLTSDYLDHRLPQLNLQMRSQSRPWMICKPTGALLLFGPIFHSPKTACWECLAQRMRLRRKLEAWFDRYQVNTREWSKPSLYEGLMPLGVQIAAIQMAKFLIEDDNPQLDGKLVAFHPAGLTASSHTVVRRPQCPVCGTSQSTNRSSPPLLLDNRIKPHPSHRALAPEETLANLQHHVSPITGLVSDLTLLHGPMDDIAKIAIAGHNFPISDMSLHLINEGMKSKSCGKGKTEAQAKVGALVEALERYSGIFTGEEYRVRASYRSLGDNAIHPYACLLYSERQYQQRDAWQRLGSPFNMVPCPFDETAEVEWSPLWSLTLRRERLLPTSYLYFGYPQELSASACWADSNGNAAGNTLEEAILQGFLELAERDAVAIWWYNRILRPAVNLASFQDHYIDQCIQSYSRCGREIWVLDISNDMGIPVFAALSRRVDQQPEEVIMGFGSHLDGRTAVIRAITELNQFLPQVSGPIGPDGRRILGYSDPIALSWWHNESVQRQPFLLPNSELRQRIAANFIEYKSTDQLVDLMRCAKVVEALGMEMLVLDQTRADVGVHVVKVIIPGLRHFWARLAPGRLYDVPVKLDWLQHPLREEQLNPIPMFL